MTVPAARAVGQNSAYRPARWRQPPQSSSGRKMPMFVQASQKARAEPRSPSGRTVSRPSYKQSTWYRGSACRRISTLTSVSRRKVQRRRFPPAAGTGATTGRRVRGSAGNEGRDGASGGASSGSAMAASLVRTSVTLPLSGRWAGQSRPGEAEPTQRHPGRQWSMSTGKTYPRPRIEPPGSRHLALTVDNPAKSALTTAWHRLPCTQVA